MNLLFDCRAGRFSALLLLNVGLMILASSANAAILGIDSVTLGGSDELLTATVGGTAYPGGVIADVAEDGRGAGIAHPGTAGSAAPTGTAVNAADLDQGLAYDNSVLTGNAGSTGNASQNGGVMVLRWGPGFTDNDADPDFFVFEDGGNDTVEVQAILADGTLGTAFSLSGWNSVSNAGVLGTNGSGGNLTSRNVTGVAFDFTDLLDVAGANLTAGTGIQGIVIGDSGSADFYEIYAHVENIPEPASFVLLGLGLVGVASSRRRT